ncbi:hypothetical protein K504DRAFT_465505 [Pleomassaria siparia CBS 279.74]|uniref:Uncharacterized protein n=1 Tax=Pleomassaria siparia CBS 279.74 TaxID=1314801 RepID=A0A6G1KH04_9PLEO|nr:hypothetical protein K504DRAFT_465505 [Pleomassaria siparia CBS 279.74]
MAGYEIAAQETSQRTHHSPKHVLPNGPCNHRNEWGPCGCERFWDTNSAHLHEGSKVGRLSSERSTQCVCGHHACMHRDARVPAEKPHFVGVGAHNCGPASCSARCASQFGSGDNLKTLPAESGQTVPRQVAGRTNSLGQNDQVGHLASRPSSSGLLPVPSMCYLPQDRRPKTKHQGRHHGSPSRQTTTGLGLAMSFGNVENAIDRPQSVTSTISDDINIIRALGQSYNEPQITDSMLFGHHLMDSPGLGSLDFAVQNQNLQLVTGGDTIPNTCSPDVDFIQSATEVATPSNANTPDPAFFDHVVEDTKALIDGLQKCVTSFQQGNSPHLRANSTTSVPASQLLLTDNSNIVPEKMQQAIRSASPSEIQLLVSFLKPIHSFLNSMPNMSNAFKEIRDRMDVFENSSFHQAQTDDGHRVSEMLDGRVTHLEHRMDDHEILHQTIDADTSTTSFNRRHLAHLVESFGSNQSSSSVALLDQTEIVAKFEDIFDRLAPLEAAALPTSVKPWEIEVVLLPWGRELRGLWFSPDEPMHDQANIVTQESEDWTQIRDMRSPSTRRRIAQLPGMDGDSSPARNAQLSFGSLACSDAESGWSSHAISEWAAESENEWMTAKAIGAKNQVYHRLRSRGFVRNVVLGSSNARDIQNTLAKSFKDLLEHDKYVDEDEDSSFSYPGLKASFIPLRKIIYEDKLRFLTHSEMANSALWNAQFLASGVMRRVSGGVKRLYVTHRAAYMQRDEHLDRSWTWPELQLLPRYKEDTDSTMTGNEEQCRPQVVHVNVDEECWAFNKNYDVPASVEASFDSSHHSAQIVMRPADRHWRRSITPNPILKHRQSQQPISPLSEFPPQRPGQGRMRTVSAPESVLVLHSSAKRRYDASPVKESPAPCVQPYRTPSASVTRLKRRRVARSSSPRPEADQLEPYDAGIPIWANTPRRSRESQSPMFSSHPGLPGLPRTNSDVASRAGAYATPHSGPYMGSVVDLGLGGGDTEPDSDNYEDDDEPSWGGVEDDDDDDDDDDDVEAGAIDDDEPADFSGDESGFLSEDEAGDEDDEDDEGEEGDDEAGFDVLQSP